MAVERLTEKQFFAYRYRREGHALDWIARRLGVSRPRVVHLIAASEKRLGYTPSVTPKRKTPYKPVAQPREEQASTWSAYMNELWDEFEPAAQERFLRILEAAKTEEEAERLLREWLAELQLERRERARGFEPSRAEHADDYSRGVGEAEAEFAAEMEADFGLNPMTGEPMRPEDFVEDAGGGYDRL